MFKLMIGQMYYWVSKIEAGLFLFFFCSQTSDRANVLVFICNRNVSKFVRNTKILSIPKASVFVARHL